MNKPILQPLPPVNCCNLRYAVLFEGERIGIVSKDKDSWLTRFPWRAWAGAGYAGYYLGEFDTWQLAAAAIQSHLTKHQTSTKE